MSRTVLVAGTASHVGKSTVAAGLCRLLATRGVDVAPFKAQTMSNNARAVVRPAGGYGEIGVAQFVQARAAGVTPTTDANPVLLKPRGDAESQLVVDGEAVAHLAAGDYYADHWERARTAAERAHARLAADHDVVVAEGAGSMAEPNLRHRDLANRETARFADADVVLVADIERGGAFASVVGTLALAPDDLTDRVAGVVVTKFRGDRELLAAGVDELEDRTGVPVLGVIPHNDPGLPAEDSVSLPAVGERRVVGRDAVPDAESVTVAVPRLPRASNVTDLEPLAEVPGVRVAYRPLTAPLEDADAVVVPGTKNTADDLLACREAGLLGRLAAFDGPVLGLCGGYQLLGERLLDADREGTGDDATIEGAGVLPVETTFSPEKRVTPVTRRVEGVGPLAGADARASGYEIRAGRTRATAPVDRPVGPESAAVGDALGTYLHSLFETRAVRDAFVDAVFAAAGRKRPSRSAAAADPYEAAADLVADHVDLRPLSLREVVA